MFLKKKKKKAYFFNELLNNAIFTNYSLKNIIKQKRPESLTRNEEKKKKISGWAKVQTIIIIGFVLFDK